MFALAGYMQRPKETFLNRILRKSKRMSKRSKTTADLYSSDDLRFISSLCHDQQRQIEELKRKLQVLQNQYKRANRNIYHLNAPKLKGKSSRKSAGDAKRVKTTKDNSFSIIL